HHPAEGMGEGALRVGEEGRYPGQSLLLLGIEDVENGADQQGMAGFLPVRPPLQRTLRINEDVGDVLDVPDLIRTFPDLKQRVVTCGPWIGRIEEQAMRELGAPAGSQLPILTLDVMNDGGAGPGEKRRNDQADALPAPGGCEGHDMLR